MTQTTDTRPSHVIRNLRWYHFSLIGRLKMAERTYQAILQSETTTDAAKEHARAMLVDNYHMLALMKDRTIK